MSFWRSKRVRAAKVHRCSCCSSTIHVSEEHVYCAGVFECDFSSYRTCAPCDDLIKALDPEAGWSLEDLGFMADEEMPGDKLTLAFHRRQAEAQGA